MSIKMTLTFNDETMETLRKKAKEEGFGRPSLLARYLMVRGLKENVPTEINDDHQVLHVPVNNYRSLRGYVEEKGLGSVEVFATFAMAQYMSRNALTPAQKQRVDENINN
jgi:hypothetical protein